jgi:hypothetical protein
MVSGNARSPEHKGFDPMIHVLLLAAALLVASPAIAAPEIGKATEITTEVTGDDAGSIRVLKAGDQVFQEERIATDDKGIGQFEFFDDTRLAIGPGSAVKLDRFVYGTNRSATSVTIQLTKGAFRFISGKSASGAYQIATPTATIGVRGTTFDVFVAADGEMAVAMIDGGVDVCARRGGCQAHNVVGIIYRRRWRHFGARALGRNVSQERVVHRGLAVPGAAGSAGTPFWRRRRRQALSECGAAAPCGARPSLESRLKGAPNQRQDGTGLRRERHPRWRRSLRRK